MLRVRPHHFFLAILLHVGVMAFFWRGASAPDTPPQAAPQPQMAALGGQPLPQRLSTLPLAAPPVGAAGAGDTAATLAPIAYAGSPPSSPHATPELPQRDAGGENPASPVGEMAGQPTPGGSAGYTSYIKEVLAPALGDSALSGVQAPSYTVRALSDRLVQDMLQGGYARLVVKAREEFFLVEDTAGTLKFSRIAELPGYAQRALPLRSAFGHSVVQAICRKYGYTAGDLAVLFFPSAPLDRLILAKQGLASRQLNTPFTELLVTEGRIVQHGRAYTFLVEHVTLKDGRVIAFEDSERQFLGEGGQQ